MAGPNEWQQVCNHRSNPEKTWRSCEGADFSWLSSQVSRTLNQSHSAVPNHNIFTTYGKPYQKGLRKQVVIFDDSDVEVQVCTAHNALIISQPARIGNTLHLIPALFYFPQQYGSEVFQKNCADAQSHSSEAAALNMKTFGNWITRTYLVICSPKWWQREV